MKPKVKIIETWGSAISLESQINQFLQKIDADNFIDIKLSSLEGIDASSDSSSSSSSLTNDKHVALIIYLEWLYLFILFATSHNNDTSKSFSFIIILNFEYRYFNMSTQIWCWHIIFFSLLFY